MKKASWNKHLSAIVRAQLCPEPLPNRRGARSHVHRHVPYSTRCATNEFRLSHGRRLVVQSAKHARRARQGVVVLHPCVVEALGFEGPLAPGLAEVPAFVAVTFWPDDEQVRNRGALKHSRNPSQRVCGKTLKAADDRDGVNVSPHTVQVSRQNAAAVSKIASDGDTDVRGSRHRLHVLC